MLKNYGLTLILLLLGLSAGVQASRITGDSDYGTNPDITKPCTISASPLSCDIGNTGASAESFFASNNSTSAVFDFMLTNPSPNSSLVLTDQTAGTSFVDWGIFSCAGGTEQCTIAHDLPQQPGYGDGSAG